LLTPNKLVVKDFQVIKSVEAEFGGLTVIVGESRTGKSAIIRALSRLFSVVPGHSDIRVGAGAYRVAVARNGHVIARKKSKTLNEYHVDGHVFNKVGRQLPPGVESALGLVEVEVGSRKVLLNLQEQFDGPFLLSETGSVVSEILGSVTGVDELYNLIASVDRDRAKTQKDKDVNDTRLQELLEKQKLFRQADEVLLESEKLWGQADALQKKVDELVLLKDAVIRLTGLKQSFEALGVAEKLWSRADALQTKADALQKNADELSLLKDALIKLTRLKQSFAVLQEVTQKVESLLSFSGDLDRLVLLKSLVLLRYEHSDLVASGEVNKTLLMEAEKAEAAQRVANGKCNYCGSDVTLEKVEQYVRVES